MKMWWSNTLKLACFIGMVLFILEGSFSAAAEPSRNSNNALRDLLKLDQWYSSVARPRSSSSAFLDINLRSLPSAEPEIGQKVQRALLRLQELDNLYASRSRPRFGKRAEDIDDERNNNKKLTPDFYNNDKIQYRAEGNNLQELDWLPLRR